MSNVFNQNPGLKAGVLCIVLVGFAGMTFFVNPDEGGICTRSAGTTTRKNKD